MRRQSEIITLPNGVFHVAEVCSGISYVLASLLLSLVYTYLTFHAAWKRAAFGALTVGAFVVLNGVRAYIVMVVANATDMRWFTGWDHVYFGQLLFFCLADCWMSWNAAKRAQEYGYTSVLWYPEGTDGWRFEDWPVEKVERFEPGR